MQNKYAELSLETLSKMLKSNTIALEVYIAATLEFIENQEPAIHALLPEKNRYERLQSDARDLQKRYPDPETRPPLFALLIGIKDLFNVDGLPTKAGSRLPAEAFAGKEAEVVTQLKKLGALILGKTVSTEFAYFSPGATCNPVNPLHSPGGSSSGSAAAVAAGYCHVAFGTQTIASIIRPASYCGVYGYKPSWACLSTEGVFPFSQSADHVGFFSRSLEDLGYLSKYLIPQLKVINSASKPVLGIVRGSYLEQADGQVKDNFWQCVMALERNGYRMVECDPFGDIELLNAMHRRMIAAEFSANHLALYARFGDLYSPPSQELYATGLSVGSMELKNLQAGAMALRQKIGKLMKDKEIDLWLTPSTTSTAPLGLESTGSPLMSLPWTNCGLPSLTLPCGFDSKGLPFGLQVIADWQHDALLFAHTIHRDIY